MGPIDGRRQPYRVGSILCSVGPARGSRGVLCAARRPASLGKHPEFVRMGRDRARSPPHEGCKIKGDLSKACKSSGRPLLLGLISLVLCISSSAISTPAYASSLVPAHPSSAPL